MYHHAPSPGAPDAWAALRSWPHDGANGSPRPMNASVVSVKIAAAKVRTVLATMQVDDVRQDVAPHDVAAARRR